MSCPIKLTKIGRLVLSIHGHITYRLRKLAQTANSDYAELLYRYIIMIIRY